jgi:hypothetical protein
LHCYKKIKEVQTKKMLGLISPVVLNRSVQLILYPNYLKQLLNFIRVSGWKVAKKCKGSSSVNYDEHP